MNIDEILLEYKELEIESFHNLSESTSEEKFQKVIKSNKLTLTKIVNRIKLDFFDYEESYKTGLVLEKYVRKNFIPFEYEGVLYDSDLTERDFARVGELSTGALNVNRFEDLKSYSEKSYIELDKLLKRKKKEYKKLWKYEKFDFTSFFQIWEYTLIPSWSASLQKITKQVVDNHKYIEQLYYKNILNSNSRKIYHSMWRFTLKVVEIIELYNRIDKEIWINYINVLKAAKKKIDSQKK